MTTAEELLKSYNWDRYRKQEGLRLIKRAKKEGYKEGYDAGMNIFSEHFAEELKVVGLIGLKAIIMNYIKQKKELSKGGRDGEE